MREILFRGKRVDNGEWVEGDLLRSRGKCYIHEHIDPFDYLGELSGFIKMYEVVPETVGQFTGLTDKNGKKIFEGDRILSEYGTIGVVEWNNEECSFLVNIGDDYQMLTDSEYQIIGDIYDNFELLQEDMK